MRTLIAAACLLAAPLAGASAQCPDGSPPPCRAAAPAGAPRRTNPPLDDRSWIVVPFDNIAKAQDVDWLRGASVNLLYLDMSRWRDIRVIDDERVADLMRETPEVGNAQTLSLNAGLAVARRAGAGRLVMGDVLKVGIRTAVTAKVYNVRTGQRIRSVSEQTVVQDSVMPLFGKLAQKILDLAPPQGAQVGALGTTRVDAYQEYVAGVEAMNKFDLTEARARLRDAIRLDSTFALAHFKMSTLIGWVDPNDAGRRSHAEIAARFQTGLPARERALIAGVVAQSVNDYTKACEIYSGLVKADSSDVEALYGIGECLYHDVTVEAVNGDTTKMRFRGDWNGSIRAFQRVLQLDPTYHLAFAHVLDVLTVDRHNNGCYRPDPGSRCVQNYAAFLMRSGDSLVAVPVRVPADSAKLRVQAEQYVQSHSRRRNLLAAHEAARAWVQSSPNELRARTTLADILLQRGLIAQADSAYARITEPSATIFETLPRLLNRIEIAYKTWNAAEAIRLYDSVRTADIPLPSSTPQTIRFGNAISGYGLAFGRVTEFDSVVAASMRQQNAAPYIVAYQRHASRAAFGLPTDSLAIAERAFFDSIAVRSRLAATRQLAPTLMYALRAPRPEWPPLDTTVRDARLLPAIALAARDTVRLRAAVATLDSITMAVAAAGVADSGFSLVAAEGYLALRDSAAALRMLSVALDNSLGTTRIFPPQGGAGSIVVVLPRMMLLRADLAAAAGRREEARTWYKRFADHWSTAVPEFQPLVERARKAYLALGGST